MANLDITTGTNSPIEGHAAFQKALEQANADGIDLNPMEKVDFCLNGDFDIAPSKQLLEQNWIVQKDGVDYCELCKKFLGWTHT